jgi:hypothetical protein
MDNTYSVTLRTTLRLVVKADSKKELEAALKTACSELQNDGEWITDTWDYSYTQRISSGTPKCDHGVWDGHIVAIQDYDRHKKAEQDADSRKSWCEWKKEAWLHGWRPKFSRYDGSAKPGKNRK